MSLEVRRSRTRRLLVLLACLVAACGDSSSIESRLVGAPSEVTARSSLPPCGVELIVDGSGYDLEARRCFWNAFVAGRQAEFITTRPTATGLPLLTIFRSLGDGKVEYFVDETAIWGARTWTHMSCPFITATVDPHVAIDWIPGSPVVQCEKERLAD
jgi:hypothetical protein